MSEGFNVSVPMDSGIGAPSAGVHRARCTAVEHKKNKAGDGYNLVMDYEVLTPAEAGRRIRVYQSLKPQVAFKFMPMFAAFGIDITGKDANINERMFVNKIVRIQVVVDENEQRPSVENVLPDDQAAAPLKVAARPVVKSLDEEEQSPKLDIDQGLDDFPAPEEDLPF